MNARLPANKLINNINIIKGNNMNQLRKYKISILSLFMLFLGTIVFCLHNCSALSLAFSPIRPEKVLIPGTTDNLTVRLIVPSDANEPSNYELTIQPFTVDENNRTQLEPKGGYSEIIDWITISDDGDRTGVIQPGESKTINYTINVPEDAPAGGQYCAVVIKAYSNNDSGIKQTHDMTHLIYAEVAGETRRQGEITSLTVPGFLFSGNLTAGASVKNLGNVHSNVKHTLKIYPLIGDEELYTNGEDPQENLIMPEATRYTSVAWEQTPSAGIFRVKYTVEFEGIKNELEKIVIICPLWLLIIILLFIVTLIYRLATSSKSGKKTKKESPAEA